MNFPCRLFGAAWTSRIGWTAFIRGTEAASRNADGTRGSSRYMKSPVREMEKGKTQRRLKSLR